MPSPTETITALLRAWGDAEAIASLVSDDAEWWITPTTGLPSPMVGRAQIHETMQRVFGEIYDPARTRAEPHHVIGDDTSAAARFTMHSHVLPVDRPYENEYAVFVEMDAGGQQIRRIDEFLDVAAARDQLAGGENA